MDLPQPNPQTRNRSLEATLASELHALLARVAVGSTFTVAPSSDLCASLELFIPTLLSARHPEWKSESLDGVFVAIARKTGAATAELAGTCILISDQTVTPLLTEITLSLSGERIESFRARIGEPGGGRLGISGPGCNSKEAQAPLAAVDARRRSIAWAYDITNRQK